MTHDTPSDTSDHRTNSTLDAPRARVYQLARRVPHRIRDVATPGGIHEDRSNLLVGACLAAAAAVGHAQRNVTDCGVEPLGDALAKIKDKQTVQFTGACAGPVRYGPTDSR